MCAAGGAMSVPSDHSATPAISTLAPPIDVDTHPAGICVSEYPQKKDDETSPRSVADQPSSFAIGITATDMFTLSMLHRTNDRAIMKTICQRWGMPPFGAIAGCSEAEASSTDVSPELPSPDPPVASREYVSASNWLSSKLPSAPRCASAE